MSERLFGIRPLLAVAGLAGLAAALGLYGFGLGTGTARVSDSRAKVQATAQAFAAARDPSGARRTVIVRSLGDTDDDAERFARTYGVDQLAEAERDGAFVLRTWDARLRTNAVTSDYEDDPDSARVTLDRTGRVVGFESKPGGDSASAPSRDQARQIAADGLKQLGISLDGFVEPTQKTSVAANVKVGTGGGLQTEVVESNDSDNDANDAERPGKSVQKFVWKRSDDRWPGLEQKVSASVTGAGLTDFSVTSEFETEQLQTRIVAAVAEATLFGVLTTGLILILLGAMLSRVISRDYVSLSRAALIAGVYAATVALAAVVTFTGKNSVVENYLGQTFAALGMAILIGAGWIAGEADAYYAWGRRSTEAALALATGSPMARQVAREVVEGFLWGWLLLGALALAAAIVAALNGGNGVFVDRELSPFDAGAIPLFWTTTLPFVGFYAVCLLLFVPAWLHRLTKRAWLAIPIAGVIASVFASTLNIADVRFGALPGTLSWALVFGISTCALAARRGWLTGAVATFAFSAFFWGTAALYSGAATDKALVGLGLLLAAAAPVAAVVLGPGRFREVEVKETPPARVSRMLELARREEELDIARRVQRGLLPAVDPAIEGFEVAGTCLPANEVGGDYYDYFNLSDGRFGVAVGDVSGKGIPAAFSMTLTKGFMEVASADFREPDLVLSKANDYLRDNLTRGTFVTMAYAILDPESRIVTCARAGHNPPAILRANERPAFITPGGPALGAAEAERFDELVEREHVELRRGETLVFYTDGVTEAMNLAREQFGEDRLLDTLDRFRSARTAREIVDGLVGEVAAFAQHADQHDDITIVVVRVPAA